jgi:mannose-1-phosphate guanylyltransferase
VAPVPPFEGIESLVRGSGSRPKSGHAGVQVSAATESAGSPPAGGRMGVVPTAVVLVGGEGTRLRPLTERIPKPMLPLLGRPILAHTFEQIAAAGASRAILACGYRPTSIEAFFGGSYRGVELEYRVEPEPLGTAGGIAYAARGTREPLLVLNGDSIRDVDLGALIEFHNDRGALATILLTAVEDPARYGLVRLDADGRVRDFLEKPSPEQIDTNLINAGVYVLEPEVLELIPEGRAVSIERQIFPILSARGVVYALPLPGYWLDVGTPESYLRAHLDLMPDEVRIDPTAVVAPTAKFHRPCVVEAGCVIEAAADVGPGVYAGAGSRVGPGARIRRAALLPGAIVERGSVDRAIVDPNHGIVPVPSKT